MPKSCLDPSPNLVGVIAFLAPQEGDRDPVGANFDTKNLISWKQFRGSYVDGSCDGFIFPPRL
jgi:hypothetical protein